MMKRLPVLDWEAIAGALAALVAIVLHLLHVVEEDVVLAVVLFILAIILIRDLRRQVREEGAADAARRAEAGVARLESAIVPPDTILIGPRRLRKETERFSQRARGEMVWYNVCLAMFRPQQLFDTLLRPAIDNPRVTAIQFVLDEHARRDWQDVVMPKVETCKGRDKVRSPRWAELPEDVSFIVAETEPDGGTEALLSFWGEPFMSRPPQREVPRYIFHVQRRSELVERLIELERLARREP